MPKKAARLTRPPRFLHRKAMFVSMTQKRVASKMEATKFYVKKGGYSFIPLIILAHCCNEVTE